MAKFKIELPKTRHEWNRLILNTFLIVIGSIILAFGVGIFIIPASINYGGISGIGIIVNKLFGFDVDIFVLISSIGLLLIGMLILGFQFTMNSILSSILTPLVMMLVLRVPFFQQIPSILYQVDTSGQIPLANFLVGGLFGGALTGIGVGLSFLGGGSTGGVDIIAFIINKYTRIRHATATLIVDATIVIGGMFILGSSYIVQGLVGVISAVVCSLTVNFVFAGKSQILSATIISEKWEEINTFIQEKMERGTTITTVEGGYQFKEYRMILVVFDRKEYVTIYNAVSRIDKKAFVTISQTMTVYGEGFNPLVKAKRK